MILAPLLATLIAFSAPAAPQVVDVGGRLKPENTLVLHFHTVFDPAGDRTKPIQRYQGMPVRRPQQNYGAYLRPRPLFSSVGVWG